MAEQRITTKPTVNALLDEDYIFINHDGALRQVRKSDADLASAAGLAAEATARQQFMTDETQARQAFETAETAARTQFENDMNDSMDEFQETVDDQVANKADVDGNYENLTAGSALQLISDKYTENRVPYLFRKSIAGDRELDTLVGGSVAWNQLVYNGNFASTTRWGGRYAEVTVSNNIATVTPTSSGTDRGLIGSNSSAPLAVYGHKYLLAVDVFSPITSYCSPSFGGGNVTADRRPVTANTWTRVCNVWTMPANVGYRQNLYALIAGTVTTEQEIKYKNAIGVDLTQMFGTTIADYIYSLEQANAGAGVALFRKLFPKDYYAYNTGELMSVKTSAHEMVGFNQWDEEWELGSISITTGENEANNQRFRSKNFIPIPEGQNFYNTDPTGNADIRFIYYNANKEFIQAGGWSAAGIRIPPKGTNYVRFFCGAAAGTTYQHNICINLSAPSRNGEYQPYIKHTYPLDDIELRGIPKLVDGEIQYDGDTYEADGTVTRKYGIVDLGTLNWAQPGAGSANARFTAHVTGIKYAGSNYGEDALYNAVLSVPYKKTSVYGALDTDKAFAIYANSDEILIRDTAYTDAAAFKTAMSGVYLVYELATPTTETADAFTSPQIVDPYGTERYVDDREVAVPVGHVTKYPDNLRQKLDNLPWDFSSLIAPTEKAYTATRNYTAGSLLIVNNVLYKATANIANGGAITPNTNVTATTLAEIISAL